MPQTLDEQSPSQTPSLNPFRVGFRPATLDDPPSSLPLPSPSPSPENLDEPAGPGSDSGDEWDAASSPESLSDTPSPASSRGSEPVKVELFDLDDLKTAARGGVAVAGQKAHDLLATTPGQRHAGLYLTDEADQVAIGDPLASIAARHQNVAGKVNPDTKDMLSALVGLFGYATKQINRRTEARAIDAGAVDPQQVEQ